MNRQILIPDEVFQKALSKVEFKANPSSSITPVQDNGLDLEFMAALERGDHLRWLADQMGLSKEESEELFNRAKALSDEYPLSGNV